MPENFRCHIQRRACVGICHFFFCEDLRQTKIADLELAVFNKYVLGFQIAVDEP
jgi:hypothetical protein